MNLIETFLIIWGVPALAVMASIYATKRESFKAIRTRNRWKLLLWCLKWPIIAYKTIMTEAEVEMARLRDAT